MKSAFRLSASLFIILGISFASEAKSLDKHRSITDSSIVLQHPNNQLVAQSTPNKLLRVLASFIPRRFRAVSTEFSLGRNSMRHILTRHHPDYLDGTRTSRQTFFKSNMTINEITDAIESVVAQNREKLHRIGPRGTERVRGVVNGVRYVLGVDKGRIGSFFPEP